MEKNNSQSEVIETTKPTQKETPKQTGEKIFRVSRVKEFGKQFLVSVVLGKAVPNGIQQIPTYRKYKDPQTGEMIVDKSFVISTKPKYTVPYTKEKAVSLVKRCIEDSEEPAFTFKQGGQKITIRNPENFTEDFDKVMKEARAGNPV